MLFEFTEEELRKMECPDDEFACPICGASWLPHVTCDHLRIDYDAKCSLGLAIQMAELRGKEKANENHHN